MSSPKAPSYSAALAVAMRCLARREHAASELRVKLLQRGFADELIATVLQALKKQDWLSDKRFVEAYLRARIARQYGPQRILYELKQKALPDVLVSEAMAQYSEEDWVALAQKLVAKRNTPHSLMGTEKAKLIRFLQQRGYTSAQINTTLSEREEK